MLRRDRKCNERTGSASKPTRSFPNVPESFRGDRKLPEQTGSGPICPRSAPKCTEVLPGDRKCSEMTGSNTNPPPELLRRSPKRPEMARNYPNYSEWTRRRSRRPEVVLRDRKYPHPPPNRSELFRMDRKRVEKTGSAPKSSEIFRIFPKFAAFPPDGLYVFRNCS